MITKYCRIINILTYVQLCRSKNESIIKDEHMKSIRRNMISLEEDSRISKGMSTKSQHP